MQDAVGDYTARVKNILSDESINVLLTQYDTVYNGRHFSDNDYHLGSETTDDGDNHTRFLDLFTVVFFHQKSRYIGNGGCKDNEENQPRIPTHIKNITRYKQHYPPKFLGQNPIQQHDYRQKYQKLPYDFNMDASVELAKQNIYSATVAKGVRTFVTFPPLNRHRLSN